MPLPILAVSGEDFGNAVPYVLARSLTNGHAINDSFTPHIVGPKMIAGDGAVSLDAAMTTVGDTWGTSSDDETDYTKTEEFEGEEHAQRCGPQALLTGQHDFKDSFRPDSLRGHERRS